MTVNEQEYPDFFPAGCPPIDALTDEKNLFRLCRGLVPSKSDFASYYEGNPEKYKNNINAYGLSMYQSNEDYMEAYRKFPRVRMYSAVAKGITNNKRGSWKPTPSKNNPNHITWWVCKDVNPVDFFEIVDIFGEKDE